jgi:hypothetical protein
MTRFSRFLTSISFWGDIGSICMSASVSVDGIMNMQWGAGGETGCSAGKELDTARTMTFLECA